MLATSVCAVCEMVCNCGTLAEGLSLQWRLDIAILRTLEGRHFTLQLLMRAL